MKKQIHILLALALLTATTRAVDVSIDKVVVGWQTEAERQQYTGLPGELVRNTTTGGSTLCDGTREGGYPAEPTIARLYADGTDAENGTALNALYTALLASNPSADNRFVIVLGPGTYAPPNMTLSSDWINIRGAVSRPVTRQMPYGCEPTGWTPPAIITGIAEMQMTGNGITLSDLTFDGDVFLDSSLLPANSENLLQDILATGSSCVNGIDYGEIYGNLNRCAAIGANESFTANLFGHATLCYSAGALFSNSDGMFDPNPNGNAVYCTGGIDSFCSATHGSEPVALTVSHCKVNGAGAFRAGVTVYHTHCTGTANWGDACYYCIGPAASVDAGDIANRHCIAE